MKRLVALAFALALVLGSSIYVIADGPYKNASDFCKDKGDFGESHGKCVSIIENLFNQGESTPVGICKVWELLFPVSFYGEYKNLGQCVSDLRKDFE
jgi:hypothetical protein